MSITHLLSPADILWKMLEDYGYDAKSIFSEEGIDYEMLLKPGVRISHATVEGLWSRVNALIEDPCFGLRGVKFWNPSHFNALGHAWLASGTLREALNRAVRYSHIIGTDRRNRLKDTPEGLRITLSHSLKQPILMDMAMSILMSACRLNYGPELNPVAVNFIHPKPACAQAYYSFFRVPVSFETDCDCITLSADVADAQLPIGNPKIAGLLDQYLISYLAELDKKNIVQRVRAAIVELLPSGRVSAGKVALQLKMSTRSLQRRLQGVRTTFVAQLEEVRKELAEHYIHDSTVSLTEVAFVLGYSEYSSFWRAYKRWTKISPGKIRK